MSHPASLLIRFEVLSGSLMPVALMLTMLFELRRQRALAFLHLLPQRTPARVLLLPANCAIGAVIALASTTVLPWLAAVALFGCWCWAVAVGHWFAGRTSWTLALVAVPLAYLALIVTAVTSAAAGRTASAVVSLALGLAGCLVPVRTRLLVISAQPTAASSRSAVAASPLDIAVRRPASWAHHVTTFQVFWATIRAHAGWSAPFLAGLCILAIIWREPVRGVRFGMMWAFSLSSSFALSSPLAVREFLHVRPVGRGRSYLRLLLPWLLLVLVIPSAGVAQLLIAESLPTEDVALVAAPERSNIDSTASIPRAHAPRQRVAHTVVMTQSLRRLLALDVLRSALLQLALFFSLGALSLPGRAEQRSSRAETLKALLMLPLLALMLPMTFPTLAPKLLGMLPPLWFAALLAASSAVALRHQLMLPRRDGGAASCRAAKS
jgi:hypothetical protein